MQQRLTLDEAIEADADSDSDSALLPSASMHHTAISACSCTTFAPEPVRVRAVVVTSATAVSPLTTFRPGSRSQALPRYRKRLGHRSRAAAAG